MHKSAVAVRMFRESLRRKQFESCGVYISRVIWKETVWKLRCIALKSHLEGSSLKVAVYISQESFRGKQFESCGAYLSRVTKKEAV